MTAKAQSGHWRGRGPAEQTDFASYPDIPDSAAAADAAQLDVNGAYNARLKGSTIPVPGCWEAIDSIMWDSPGSSQPVIVVGPRGARGEILGTLAAEGAEVLKQHPEAFRPLVIPVDYPAEDKRPKR